MASSTRLALLALAMRASGLVAPRSHNRAQIKMGMGNSFGRCFRISTWGESHGGGVGVVVDGCPPRVPLTEEPVQFELNRRRPGQSRLTTPRNESDTVEILSGVDKESGVTLGTPIAMLVRNKDQKSNDYDTMAKAYRPSHADATYDAKYGVRAVAGGGRSSARETIGRVAGGAVAREVLKLYSGVEVLAYVQAVQDVRMPEDFDRDSVTLNDVEASMVRCPDPETAEKMIERIDQIRRQGNSIGGVVECVAYNVPAGLGAPVFDKLEAELAKACMSLPASKGFEIGSGFGGTLLAGKDHNDEFYVTPTAHADAVNRSGGVQGGIRMERRSGCAWRSSPLNHRPAPETMTRDGKETEQGQGPPRPGVLPRAAPMVESMVALVWLMLMQQKAQCDLGVPEPPGFSGWGLRRRRRWRRGALGGCGVLL